MIDAIFFMASVSCLYFSQLLLIRREVFVFGNHDNAIELSGHVGEHLLKLAAVGHRFFELLCQLRGIPRLANKNVVNNDHNGGLLKLYY